jgi:uncharacterized membrane protein
MSHNSATATGENFPRNATPVSGERDEILDQLLFSESIDDLLASGEMEVDDLPFDQPIISDESLSFLIAQAAEIPALIARGELIEIIANDF